MSDIDASLKFLAELRNAYASDVRLREGYDRVIATLQQAREDRQKWHSLQKTTRVLEERNRQLAAIARRIIDGLACTEDV